MSFVVAIKCWFRRGADGMQRCLSLRHNIQVFVAKSRAIWATHVFKCYDIYIHCAWGRKWLSKPPNNGGPYARAQLWVCPISLSFIEDKRALLRQPRLAQWRMDNSTALSQLQEPSFRARATQARPKGEAASFQILDVTDVVADDCDRMYSSKNNCVKKCLCQIIVKTRFQLSRFFDILFDTLQCS